MTVSEEVIQLREGTTELGVRKESVLRVTLLDKSHSLRNVLIFGAVGCGVGAGMGLRQAQPRVSLTPKA
jgi:thiamine pyrophosphate-dependent acetolactate synthase large subunit-like protein